MSKPSRVPNITAALVGAEPILRRLSAGQRKAAVRAAFELGGNWWMANYLPMRFTRYATAKLGYVLRSGHIKRKKNYRVPEPLVWTGQTRETVLYKSRIATGGSADAPWAEIRMRTPGPRAPIVYAVLNQILPSEMPGVATAIAEQLTLILNGAVSVGGKSKRLTLAGATSSLSSRPAAAGRSLLAKRDEQAAKAEDQRVAITERRTEARARVANGLKRTHQRWSRQSGGSAAGGAAAGMSRTYAGSSRFKHAAAQRQHRARYGI